jgi:hypothetical protein
MKPQHATGRRGGFTKWDLLIVVVAVTMVLGFLLMPRPGGGKAKASRINCISNLKQIGLAFRMWSNDNGEKFPMATNSGTMEFNLTGEVWRHFQAISNEVNTPKVFVCALDKQRSRPADWRDFTNNSHLSYLAGLDADETKPQTILSGDRNLTSATVKPVNGVLNLTTSDRLEWTKKIHNQNGNIGLGDGSAQQVTSESLNRQLQAAFLSTTQAVHRLALPE